jgi:hypothetical protein
VVVPKVGVTSDQLRGAAGKMGDLRDRVNGIRITLENSLATKGAAWGGDGYGTTFADGPEGYLAARKNLTEGLGNTPGGPVTGNSTRAPPVRSASSMAVEPGSPRTGTYAQTHSGRSSLPAASASASASMCWSAATIVARRVRISVRHACLSRSPGISTVITLSSPRPSV